MLGTKVRQYRIEEKLSSGGFCDVYRAHDERLRRDVAIKFLPQRSAERSTAVARFIREARAASALNHPNIVTILDAGKAKVGRFIVMELVRGRTLREVIGERTAPDALLIASQIAKALAAAHAGGIIHRDIKPENIMIRDDGYVKVLDFGLARWDDSIPGKPGTPTDPGTVLGTLRYMSPEQARGGNILASTDVFSLGIVLYELVTGKHPFEAHTELETLQAICSSRIMPPRHWNAAIPLALDRLIGRMLEKQSHLRPQADDVARFLEQIAETGLSYDVDAAAPRQALVGRHHELVRLRALLDSTHRGRGLLVLITGEPGIGKTALVEDFLSEQTMSQRNCAVGRGACSERFAGTEAYLSLFEALEDLLGGTPSLAGVMKRVAPNWYQHVTRNSTEAVSTGLPGQLKTASRELLNRELAAFLEEASFAVPLVLFLDDLHWADESTIDLLGYVSKRFDEARILILACYRPEELQLHHQRFSQLALDLQARRRCQKIDLNFLNIADVEAFLSLEFPPNNFPPVFPKLIHAKTEGNPFFMVEVLRYLREKRIISRTRDIWTLSEELPDIERHVPQSIVGMVQRKIEALPPDDRKLLAIASIQGVEFDSPVIARAFSMDTAEVEERLDRLHRVRGLIQTVGERELPDRTVAARYKFVHFLYYAAFYNAIQPARKVEWSGAVAKALLYFFKNHDVDVAAQIAFLFESARDFAPAARYFSLAAENAIKIFAFAEAESLARRGLNMLEAVPNSPARAQDELELQLRLGIPLLSAKGYGNVEVQQIYNRARELCVELEESPRLFAVLWGLESYYASRLELPIARDIAEQLMRLAQDSQDKTALLVAHLSLGVVRYCSGEFESALEHLKQYRVYDDSANRVTAARRYGIDPGTLMRAFEARALWWVGYPETCLNSTEESLALSRSLTHAPTLALILALAATTRLARGDAGHVETLARELIHQGAEHGLQLWTAEGNFFDGWVKTQLNRDSAEGIELMGQSLAAYKATGTELFLPHGYAILAECYWSSGRHHEGLQIVREALNLHCVNQTRPACYAAELLRIEGQLLGALGDPEGAESRFTRALGIVREQKVRSCELRAAVSLSELWRIQGKPEKGLAVLAPVYESFSEGLNTRDLTEARTELERYKYKTDPSRLGLSPAQARDNTG